ncbi:GNAT family N-acetyltransferase [Cellulomonas marina]|uniref:Ribosomal protein S18 acetylase RimI n=1 Tax=Cellulomonas marina TaxID=988821 RepID=A0A1I0YR55_9CELL|nr:GNAT family N-acetyltransferase [Cellulomonas marina]GIG27608.1 N-acetyltransferase [Cellulomonas marina]SFB14930.1 Ribosomal protein S18 acetylase RimI [Cellulomonas marina]
MPEEELDEVTVRPAVRSDAAAIAAVHVRSWQEAYGHIVPAAFLSALDPVDKARTWTVYLERAAADDVEHWVAEVGGEVAGFASVGPSRDEDARRHEREIYSMYLDPGRWGHGIARDLMRAVVGSAGDVPMSLWVLQQNERAQKFYRRHGFHPDGVERYEEIGGSDLLEVRYRRG